MYTGILSNNQWAFRAGRSTEGLLIHLPGTWKQALDNRQVVGVVYIDFQKAFDTVSHTILTYKLEAIGITGDLLNWMISYLTNRKQFAIVNGCTQTKNVCCGVPQGSLLGQDYSPITSIISQMQLLKVKWPCMQTIQPCLWSVTTWK